jgi:dockerin type I repeat protein
MKYILAKKWHSLPLLVAGLALLAASLLFTDASGKPWRISSATAAVAGGARTGSYSAGNFAFTNPLELTGHPASPAFFQADAEPEVVVDLFGNIYATAIQGIPGGTDLWKSTDKGASFAYLGEPDGAQDHCNPPLVQCAGLGGGDDQIDVSSGGYLYVSSLWLGNVTMSTSYDGGTGGTEANQAWQVNPIAANVVSDDRQWVAAYGPQTVYMTFATTALTRPPGSIGLFITKSTDAGKTFPSLVEITAPSPLDTVNVASNLVVDQYNGNLYTAYIPNGALNVIKLASSTDGGTTWNITTAYTGPAGTTNRGVFPILAVDKGGNLHVVFTNSRPPDVTTPYRTNSHVYLMSTANPGAANPAWLAPVQIDNSAIDPDTTTACEAWVVAGSPGVVDIAWLGTKEISTDQQPATVNTPVVTPSWHVFFAQTVDAMSPNPVFNQTKVSPNVVHNHSICMDGLGCTAAGTAHGEPGNRDLLEYFRMALDPEGNANIVYADSVNNCDPATCRTNTWFARQNGGGSAYAPPAGPAPVTFSPNISLGSPGGEPGLKVDSHNCIFATAPGEPWLRKSVNSGASFLAKVDPVADRPLSAGDEDVLPIPQANGDRPDLLYFVDLAQLAAINVAKSTDGGFTWAAPGPGGAAGEVDASTDRQWIAYDRNVPASEDLTVYEVDHEAASEEIRFNALTNDTAWSPAAAGMTDPELILPPNSTFPNTNPGPVFVDPRTHLVYGIFNASTINTNRANPPFGKMPNVWEAVGPAPTTAGAPPGPFINHPVFRGVFDSPASPQPTPPPGAETIGTNCSNDFPAAAIDNAGNIYVAWAMNNSRTNEYMVWFASSHDHGNSFYGPFQVSTGPGAALMPWIAAGDSGRVEIVYYATDHPGDPNFASAADTHWNAMFAQSFDAADREPVFTISQVSDHIMHNGGICNQGLLCQLTTGGDRSLADFFQVAIGPDGLANVVFADNGSSSTHATFARQTSGPVALINPTFPTCIAPATIHPVSAASRKTHGSLGPFDIALAVTGTPSVECRSGGTNEAYQVVMTFAAPVSGVGGAYVTSGAGSAAVAGSNGSTVSVDLTGVDNAQTITITLTDVNVGGTVANAAVSMSVLIGDINQSGRVDSGDVFLVQQANGKALPPAGGTDFKNDVNASGRVDSGDVFLVRKQNPSSIH